MARLNVVVGALSLVMMAVLGVYGSSAADADPVPGPRDPLLPTLFTNPQTYIVNGDGTRTECVAIDQALSCDWR